MTKRSFFIWMTILACVLLLTVPYAWQLLKVVFMSGSLLHQLEIFKWVTVGFILFAIARRYIKHNLEFLETFSHELTHTIFAFLFNLRVVEFHANQSSGYMMHTGLDKGSGKNVYKGVPISLAPYCFPLFTFMLLSLRWMMDFHGMWIFDILIGCTICFHFYCFKSQIGNYQTDINQYPLILSYTYIITSWILVFCIIVPAFFPNMNGHGTGQLVCNYGVFSSIWRLIVAMWTNLLSLLP